MKFSIGGSPYKPSMGTLQRTQKLLRFLIFYSWLSYSSVFSISALNVEKKCCEGKETDGVWGEKWNTQVDREFNSRKLHDTHQQLRTPGNKMGLEFVLVFCELQVLWAFDTIFD